MAKSQRAARPVSDDAVKARTGKTWAQWFTLLDKAGARKLVHRDIAALLSKRHGVPDWWAQMVTVGYERARGRRRLHERPGGYEVGVSKTIAAPASVLHRAWADARLRQRWLRRQPLTIRTSTPPRRLRASWPGGSWLDVNLYAKGRAKTQVTVQHGGLKSAKAAASTKKCWAAALEKLDETFGARRGD